MRGRSNTEGHCNNDANKGKSIANSSGDFKGAMPRYRAASTLSTRVETRGTRPYMRGESTSVQGVRQRGPTRETKNSDDKRHEGNWTDPKYPRGGKGRKKKDLGLGGGWLGMAEIRLPALR